MLVCFTKFGKFSVVISLDTFFSFTLFLLSYGTLITWSFLVYFLLFRFFNFYVIPGHSQILSSLDSAVKHIHWGFFTSCCITLVQKPSFGFSLYLLFYCCWTFLFLTDIFLFFSICFQPVYKCLLKHFHDACFKIFQIILTSVSSVLVLVSCLSPFHLRSSWFLVQIAFN